MTPPAGTDAGLLAPTWAGTAAAALVTDDAVLQAMLDVEVALARAQARLGLVPEHVVPAIAGAARGERLDLVDLAWQARQAANPVVGLVQALVEAVAADSPEAAEYVHRGGTSQDILDSAIMLVSGEVLEHVAEDLRATAGSLADLARRHRGSAMAGRTLTQHAVPTTFGLKAAGWLVLVLDALDRVEAVRCGLPAQLGGAAGTLASYAEYAALMPQHRRGEDTARVAVELVSEFSAELGLAEPVVPWHALRTPLADLASVLTFVTGALGKFALDVQGMSRTEVGEVAEPAAAGRGASSAMPQKRNPVLATLIVTASRQVPVHAAVLGQSMLAEDERSAGAWHAEWQPLRECLRLTGGAASTASELAAGLEVSPSRMRSNLDLSDGTIVAERLNAQLAPRVGKTAAKKLLTRVAFACADGKGSFAELLAGAPELDDHDESGAPLQDLLAPENYLGASDLLVGRALERYQRGQRK